MQPHWISKFTNITFLKILLSSLRSRDLTCRKYPRVVRFISNVIWRVWFRCWWKFETSVIVSTNETVSFPSQWFFAAGCRKEPGGRVIGVRWHPPRFSVRCKYLPARADRIDKFLDSSSIIRFELTKSRKSLRSCFPRFSPYYRPVIFSLLSIHRNLDASHARPRDTRDTRQRYAFALISI